MGSGVRTDLNPGFTHRPAARNGVGPSCVSLPDGPWSTVAEFLIQRFPRQASEVWHTRLAAGDITDAATGNVIAPDAPYVPHRRLYYFRALPAEPAIPFTETVLWQDDYMLVADKPHFLPVVPSGIWIGETLLARLARLPGNEALAPVHRIDRETAGLVLFTRRPQARAAYHGLFRTRQVHKVYEAIAPWRDDLRFPLLHESHIAATDHFMRMRESPGPANAVTRIDVIEVQGCQARYRLEPVTGRRHQLRVQMAALGLPIVGDRIYPVLHDHAPADFSHPLQLLAREIRFNDPFTGEERHFTSQHTLAWEPGPPKETPGRPKFPCTPSGGLAQARAGGALSADARASDHPGC